MTNWITKTIEGNPSIGLVVASFMNGFLDNRRIHALHCLVYSILSQSYPNWKMIIVHDGPIDKAEHKEIFHNLANLDPRIQTVETEERIPHYGHPHRHKYALELNCDYTGFTNEDNYYIPVYFEAMLYELVSNNAEFVHCDIIHSHWLWDEFHTKPHVSYCDVGSFVAKTSKIKEVPWSNEWYGFEGDGRYISALGAACKVVHLKKALFVHN